VTTQGFTTNIPPVSRSFSCDDVIDDKIVRSIGLDPIVIDTPKQITESPRKRMPAFLFDFWTVGVCVIVVDVSITV
jgi:hypothetical protein